MYEWEEAPLKAKKVSHSLAQHRSRPTPPNDSESDSSSLGCLGASPSVVTCFNLSSNNYIAGHGAWLGNAPIVREHYHRCESQICPANLWRIPARAAVFLTAGRGTV